MQGTELNSAYVEQFLHFWLLSSELNAGSDMTETNDESRTDSGKALSNTCNSQLEAIVHESRGASDFCRFTQARLYSGIPLTGS